MTEPTPENKKELISQLSDKYKELVLRRDSLQNALSTTISQLHQMRVQLIDLGASYSDGAYK